MNVSLEKELKQLKRAEENKIERENPIDDIKLLISGDCAEDLRISRAIGKQHSLTYGESIAGRSMELENLEKKYGKVFTSDQIETLAIKYNLRFLNSEYFTGNMSIEAITKIKEFAKDTGADISEASLAHKIFILAPEKCFKLENVEIIRQKDLDPVMFYRLDTGVYRMIWKWGKDFTILRLISGWKYKCYNNYWWTTFANILPFATVFLTLILPTLLKYDIPVFFGILTLMLTAGVTQIATHVKRDNGESKKQFWSPCKWNSQEYYKYKN